MNIIDTRDLQERLDELQDELTALQDAVTEAQEELDNCTDEEEQEDLADALNEATAALEDFLKSDDKEELDELQRMADEIPDWRYGAALISDDDFEEYAEELAGDLYGREITDAAWPFSCIDWQQAADELRSDYSCVEYQGTTYLYR